jgi:hypothetical protein
MGDTALNVPVKTRTHELNQLHEFFPTVEEGLREAELDEAADEVARIYDEHVSGVSPQPREAADFAAYVSMPAEDWRMTVRYFGRLRHVEGLRSEWLRIKLVDRLEDRLEEME